LTGSLELHEFSTHALPARKTREAEPAQDSSVFPIPGVFPLLIFAHLTVPQARGNQTVVDGAVRIAGRVVMKDDVQAILIRIFSLQSSGI
jgi:hypothetical protein